jgi:hypothetical protein
MLGAPVWVLDERKLAKIYESVSKIQKKFTCIG